MAQVESRDRIRMESFRDGDHDSIDNTQSKSLVLAADALRLFEVRVVTPLDYEDARGEILEKRFFGALADAGTQQVVHLRQDRPGKAPGLGIGFIGIPDDLVVPFVSADQV